MKRATNLIPEIADWDNLRYAFWRAAKGKVAKPEVQVYRACLDRELSGLRKQILLGEVQVGDYRYFRIRDPKPREICACVFREQVLHHALMHICHTYFERKQIYDSYASRPKKGTHAAVKRAKYFSHRYSWYLKLDVRKFFASISHPLLNQQLAFLFKEPRLLAIYDQIIGSYTPKPNTGLPIGNLTSQYFANHYLSGLDHMIKEELKVKGYVRYMDDMVLWADRKSTLKEKLSQIEAYLSEKLALHLKPPILGRSRHGVPFLGYLIFPTYVRLSQRSKKRFQQRLNYIMTQYHRGLWHEARCQRHLQPMLSFIDHAHTLNLKKMSMLRVERNHS